MSQCSRSTYDRCLARFSLPWPDQPQEARQWNAVRMNVADISARSLLAVEASPGKRPMPPEQGPEWAPSAHVRGLFAAANVSCGGGHADFTSR